MIRVRKRWWLISWWNLSAVPELATILFQRHDQSKIEYFSLSPLDESCVSDNITWLLLVCNFLSSVKGQSSIDLLRLTKAQMNTEGETECYLGSSYLWFFSVCLPLAYLKVHKLCLLHPSLTSSKLPADINLYAFFLYPSLRLPFSVFPPCLQTQNKPKQNYQRSYGLGAKCWLCWIESFEVYRALRLKCHHWNLSIIFTSLLPLPHLPCPPQVYKLL